MSADTVIMPRHSSYSPGEMAIHNGRHLWYRTGRARRDEVRIEVVIAHQRYGVVMDIDRSQKLYPELVNRQIDRAVLSLKRRAGLL